MSLGQHGIGKPQVERTREEPNIVYSRVEYDTLGLFSLSVSSSRERGRITHQEGIQTELTEPSGKSCTSPSPIGHPPVGAVLMHHMSKQEFGPRENRIN